MKKIIAIVAAAAAMFSLNSCEGLIDMITTVPTFSVESVVYNGQEQVLVRLSTCAYVWKSSSEACTITVNPSDSVATAKFLIDSDTKNSEDITITAYNKLHPEKTSEQKTSIHAWTWAIYDEAGKKISTFDPGKTYTIKLIDRVTEQPIERIYKSVKVGKEGYVYESVKIRFFGGLYVDTEENFGLNATSANVEYTFTIPAGYQHDQVDLTFQVGSSKIRIQSYLVNI